MFNISSTAVSRERSRQTSGLYADQRTSRTEQFFDFIHADFFPCVGAKAALARGEIFIHEFGMLNSAPNNEKLLNLLGEFVTMMNADDSDPAAVHSFVAVFTGPFFSSELDFEKMLWSQLYDLHLQDVQNGEPAAAGISGDAQSPRFSLSLAGHPFFVIGLHPTSSRLARRFNRPVMVFNSHHQFEKLRADGRYQKMQKATRRRDIALQGSINPNLADFGDISEARQYSGRKVGPDWTCPFDFEKARRS